MEADARQILAPEIKLAQTLPRLIKLKGFNRNRKIVCGAVKISPSSLSQYERGESMPSIMIAARLAAFFDVTLDFLLFGEDKTPRREVRDEPYFRYIDSALLDLRAQIVRHSWLVSEIGDLLAKRIDRAAHVLSGSPLPARHPGLLSDKSTYRAESYSLDTFVGTTSFSDDIRIVDGRAVLGQFLPVVIQNIKLQRRYRFVLPAGFDWSKHVNALRRTLDERVDNSALLEDMCEIRQSRSKFPIGFCYYRVDVVEMKQKEPEFFRHLEPFLSDDGFLCYSLPTNRLVQGIVLVERDQIADFIAYAEQSWEDAKPI
jgi:transcriptional regulator with XRE-family HTH domain